MNPQQIAIRLVAALFEDEHYLIVNKPAGLRATPATPGDTGGLELIGSLYGGTELQRVRPLDQHVSGVLV
ncbi:MAG: RluA family pseudouridine synthase, partial [Planctomycetota bacterium]